MEEQLQPLTLLSKEQLIQQIKDNFNNFVRNFDLSKTNYQLDELQNRMLEFYLANDRKFRRSYHVNFTESFIIFLKDKVRLKEPFHVAVQGLTRSGKSSVTSTICFIMMAMGGKLFSVEPYITANNIEFLEKVNSLSMEDVGDTIFQIDEEKSYFGLGSNAKKFKLQDVQNIIAKANISTASLCPTKFSNENAHYGLRTFGRCFDTKTVRLMLYNLQEGGKGGTLPLGMIYLPIPSVILPEELFKKFDGEYQSKKDNWIQDERRGKTDVMGELKRKTAQNFMNDDQFLTLKKKDEKLTYIRMKLGAEWTVGETLEIYNITKLYSQGINLDK
jgi:hypothetical protein